jgi:hypothetical protein
MSTMPIYALVDTWNASGTTFTGIGLNVTDTASAAGSLLLDLQVGGTSQFKVSKGGRVTAQTLTIGLGGQTAVASNTAVGFEALNSASLTGAENTGVGYRAGTAITSGSYCTAVGMLALRDTTTGNQNTAVGNSALRTNLTGAANTAVGMWALRLATTADENSAVGDGALRAVTTAGFNSALGSSAGAAVTTGVSNSCFGRQAGDVITTGARNTIIGAESDPSANNGVDQTVVGEGLIGKGDDTAFIGGTNGAYNEKNVTTWETTSDARIKKNVSDFNDGLAIIEALRVRTFEYRSPEEITELSQSAAINRPGVQLGVIAQEIREVLPMCVTQNSTGVLSVNTDPLVWHLINAVKELSARVVTLEEKTNA